MSKKMKAMHLRIAIGAAILLVAAVMWIWMTSAPPPTR